MPESKAIDPKRSDACKRAWDTIRKNRELRAAGLPVPTPAKAKTIEKDYSTLIAGWLKAPVAEPPAPIGTAKPRKPRATKVAKQAKRKPAAKTGARRRATR